MNVTFCGHSDVSQRGNVRQWLYEAVEGLITQETADTFLLGGYGGFDRMASFVVWELKKKYPHVKSILVLPYLQKRINVNSAYYESMFDLVLIPSILEGVHYKHAIVLRNRWMVEQADYVIAMVERKEGGAYATLQYAKKKKKKIINLAERKK